MKRQSTLRRADDRDWFRFYGVEPFAPWFGYVAEDNHMLLGIGGAFEFGDGRWHAFLSKSPGVRAGVTTYKAAKLTMDEAAARGLPIYAMADDRIGSACAFLKRLGFVETDEELNGVRYWTR